MNVINAYAYLEILNDGEQLTKVCMKFPKPINAEEAGALDIKFTVAGKEISSSNPILIKSRSDFQHVQTSRYALFMFEKNPLLSTLHFNAKKFVNELYPVDIHIKINNPAFLGTYLNITFVRESFLHDFTHSVFEADGSLLHYYIYNGKWKDSVKPLVIFLHGSGERGAGEGLPLLASDIVKTIYSYTREKEDAVILVPQASWEQELNGWFRKDVRVILVQLIKSAVNCLPIDCNRIYITGVSNGGAGTWHMIQNYPDIFSAAVPICGYIFNDGKEFLKNGSARYMEATQEEGNTLKDMPVWAFHAKDDPVVSIEGSRSAVNVMKKAGNDQVKLTELDEGTVTPNPHASWEHAYDNPDLLPWLFSQKK